MNEQLPYYLNGLTGISDKTLEMHGTDHNHST